MKRKMFFWAILIFAGVFSKAQTTIDFEELTLEPDSFWNGSDLTGGFYSKGIFFVNYYDTIWGSWSGFAYSNKTDTITPGYENQYSTIAGAGVENSSNFALMYVSPYNNGNFLKLTSEYSNGSVIEGFYITNNTFAYISMRDGDEFAKKFGGESGNDPDWFKLTVKGYFEGSETGTAEFYLADYRFENNDSDYIVKEWTWFDLTNLGVVDSITFVLSSSDTGPYGINTPQYFCMDNLILSEDFNGTIEIGMLNAINVFPNPIKDKLYVSRFFEYAYLYDINGTKIKEARNNNQIDLNNLPSGVYILKAKIENKIFTKKIIK